VSFLLNQTGHLDPTRTTTHLVSLALITSHLENKNEKRRKHDCKSQTTRAINNTRITLSLMSLITNGHLSQLWNLERLEALIVSLNGLLALVLNVKDWSAWGVVNGGGWGCIYSPQLLSSRCPLSADRGRSAPLVRTVCPCTSTAEIATVSSNGYINGYYALNASSDVR
jgi:hypothetical protein